MKRGNEEAFFGEIITVTNTYNREQIYNGMKFNNYGLESFESGYKNLDNFYYEIQIKNTGGTESTHSNSNSISNSLVPHKIVKEGITKKIKDFNLTKISGDKRLLSLLPEKSHNCYILSNFYKEFTNFQLHNADFVRTHSFDNNYMLTELEISDIFPIHIIHSNDQSIYSFDYLSVFQLAKAHGLEKGFDEMFYEFLEKNDTNVIATEENFSKGKTKAIVYILSKHGQFSIRKDGFYHHYISETFYSSLLRTQKRLNETYNTWYSISRTNISNGHPLSKAIKNINEKGLRLFYCNKNLGQFDVEEFVAPIEDIKLFIRNSKNPDNKNDFFERVRKFKEIFPDEEKLI